MSTAILTIAIVAMTIVVTPAPAPAQTRADGVVDILKDLLGLDRVVRGHVVQSREATLVLRGEDERTYTINTAGLDVDGVRRLRDGRPVSVSVKTPGPEAMPIATSVTLQAGPARAFRRIDGSIVAMTDEVVTFKTYDGRTLTLDQGRIVGEAPRVALHEPATLIYEQEPRLAGVWLESRDVQPAAAPRSDR